MAWPTAFFEVMPLGAMVLMAPPRSTSLDDGVVASAVVDVNDAGHHPFPHARPAQHDASLVKHLDNIAVFNAARGGVLRD